MRRILWYTADFRQRRVGQLAELAQGHVGVREPQLGELPQRGRQVLEPARRRRAR